MSKNYSWIGLVTLQILWIFSPLLCHLSYQCILWEERDLNPQSQMRSDLQSERLPITGYPPKINNCTNHNAGLEPTRPDLTQVVRFDRRPRVTSSRRISTHATFFPSILLRLPISPVAKGTIVYQRTLIAISLQELNKAIFVKRSPT